MQTRPFYKRLASLFQREPKPLVTPPTPPAPVVAKLDEEPVFRIKRSGTKSVKGAFGKCHQYFHTADSRDRRFNHSLRRQR